MALEVRRIVTGHDSQGRPVVATDERLAAPGAAGRAGISRVDVWSTDKMPIDNSDAAAELQRKGFVVRHNYVGSGQGSVCRVGAFAPGGAKFMPRSATLDYAISLGAKSCRRGFRFRWHKERNPEGVRNGKAIVSAGRQH